jgi:hypothetical protein
MHAITDRWLWVALLSGMPVLSAIASCNPVEGPTANTLIAGGATPPSTTPPTTSPPVGSPPSGGIVGNDTFPRIVTPSSPALLPAQWIDTRDTAFVSNGVVRPVHSGDNLQQIINSANAGDRIVIDAGATFVGPFTLPAKANAAPNAWITIRTSTPDASLALPGRRVAPSAAPQMAKLVSPTNGLPALSTLPGASYYRIVGIEVALNPGSAINYGLVQIGDGGTAQNSLANIPHHIVIDRSYIHGTTTGALQRCLALNSAWTAIVNSQLLECHNKGFDTQAIGGWNGPGPFKIVNNHLEGAGMGILFGGADPAVQSLVPSDIEVRRNLITRPRSWQGVWTIKNLFELKNAQRVLVEGNVMFNNWVDAQSGFAVLFTPRNQSGGAPWSVVRDVTFRYNMISDAPAGFSLLGSDDIFSSQPTVNLVIEHNVIERIATDSTLGNTARFVQAKGPASGWRLSNNTVVGRPTLAVLFSALPAMNDFTIRNNIFSRGSYGVVGTGTGEGTASLNAFAAGSPFVNNALFGPSVLATANYPTSNWVLSDITKIGFTSATAPTDFRLSASSAYRGAGTDGRDLGPNMDSLYLKIAGVTSP